jgi:hypothetical protein
MGGWLSGQLCANSGDAFLTSVAELPPRGARDKHARMRRAIFLGFVLLLAGCAEHWQNIASGARSDIIACNNAKNNADSWGVFYYCDKANGVPLPPECLVSDDAARSPKCVAIAKGEAMTGAVTSTGQTAITAGTLFVP